MADTAAILDFPRSPDRGLREGVWLGELMARYDHWRDIVDMKPAQRIEREVSLLPPNNNRSRCKGHCRADAIIWHDDSRISIVEAKIKNSPTDVCGAIGQLIYYKTLAETHWGVTVEAMLVASAYLPPFILESIANIKAPIRFLKRDEGDHLFGLVPDYAELDNGKAA